jgi:hypothetical protein
MDFVRVSVMLWLQVHEGCRRYYVIVPLHLVILFSALVPNVISHGLRYLVIALHPIWSGHPTPFPHVHFPHVPLSAHRKGSWNAVISARYNVFWYHTLKAQETLNSVKVRTE